MANKLIGFGFVCISAVIYFGHYILTAVYASTITGYGDKAKMVKAVEMIGNEPRFVA